MCDRTKGKDLVTFREEGTPTKRPKLTKLTSGTTLWSAVETGISTPQNQTPSVSVCFGGR